MSLLTKSDLVLRDKDLLQQMDGSNVIQVSVKDLDGIKCEIVYCPEHQ